MSSKKAWLKYAIGLGSLISFGVLGYTIITKINKKSTASNRNNQNEKGNLLNQIQLYSECIDEAILKTMPLMRKFSKTFKELKQNLKEQEIKDIQIKLNEDSINH